MQCPYQIGQKVVCIGRFNGRLSSDQQINVPVQGQVYTIRGILPGYRASGQTEVGLYLVEVVNPPSYTLNGFLECNFLWTAFKPLEEYKTDISVFTKMLTPAPETIDFYKKEEKQRIYEKN